MKTSTRLRAIASACAVVAGVNTELVFAQSAPQQLPDVNVTADRAHGDSYAPANTTTGLKIDAPLRDVPQTINVIPQEMIRDQGARSLQDVMKNIPGIGLATGDGQRDAFVIRGFSALTDVFLDGVRDDAQYFRDLYNIDRIEIIKGPAAVLYGRGSSGGLINRITKKPTFTPSGEIGVTMGSHYLRRTDFNINQPVSDTVAVRLDGALEDSGSYRDQGYLKNRDLSPSLLWKDGNQSLLLQFDYQHQDRAIDFGVPGYRGAPANVSPSLYYGARNAAANDTTISDMRASTAQYRLRIDQDTALTNTLRYYQYTLNRNHTRINSVNDLLAVPTVTLGRGNIQRDEHGWFNQTELTRNVQAGDTSHKVLVGLEVGEQNKYQMINNSSAAPYAYATSLFAPVLKDLPFTVQTAPQSRGVATQDTAAVYAQSLSSWTSTIKTLAGLRFDRFGQKYDDQLPGNRDLQRTDNAVSPRFGVVWQPNNWQSYYASFSKSFQPSSESAPLAINNAQLAPEKTRNLEIGSKTDLLDGRASFTAAVYQLTRTDIKVTDPTNTSNLIPVGEQQSRGVELNFTGEVTPGWQVIAGYSYMNAKVTKAVGNVTSPLASAATPTPLEGKTLAQAPRHTASLWTLKSLDQWIPGVQVGGGVTYRGANYASIDNAVRIPGFVTTDLGAYYHPAQKGWNLALNLKNLFDKRYYISSNNDIGILPGAPRSVELSARYAF